MGTYRCRYLKGENVKFISHLDMMRLFERTIRRTGLPVEYSNGFNPRPMVVFGMPLPVGVTSEAEYVDITLSRDLSCQDVVSTLNDGFPRGVMIKECILLEQNASNIMKSVTAAEYLVEVDVNEITLEAFFEALNAVFMLNTPLNIMKRSKSGEKLVDVRPLIYNFELRGDRLCFVTAAGNTISLRPDLALAALAQNLNQGYTVRQVHRTKLIFSY